MSDLTVTRVVHASVLIDFAGSTILTDPWFSQASGHRWGEPLGVELARLPRLTGVAISHGDYDHCDLATFGTYPHKDVPFAVRRGLGAVTRQAGFTNVAELEPWETTQLGPVTVTAAPAKHKENLGVPQNTYILQAAGFTVYFGGDTLLTPELAEVARRFPRIDLALLPINGLKIRPLLNRRIVMNAQEAAQLCAILQPRLAVPIHYRYHAAFPRSLLLGYEGTPEEFAVAVADRAPGTNVKTLDTGVALRLTADGAAEVGVRDYSPAIV